MVRKIFIVLGLLPSLLAAQVVTSSTTVVTSPPPITGLGLHGGHPIEYDPLTQVEWGDIESSLVSETEWLEREGNLVTEAEYAIREAARPPVVIPPQEMAGTTVVRNETQLIAALLIGKDIVNPGETIQVKKPLVIKVKGTKIRGLGLGNTKIIAAPDFVGDRLIHPQAPDITIQDICLSGGTKRISVVNMDGLSRVADRFTIDKTQIESTNWGIGLSGGPGADPLEDFTFSNGRIVDFSEGGIHMAWEIIRPKIINFCIIGNGVNSNYNGIWIGLGVLDGHIINGTISKVNRIGLEAYYPHGTWGGLSHVTTQNPYGPGMTFNNLVVSDTGSMGISLAGCKRSNISNLIARNTKYIGIELIDEDSTRSDYNVSNLNVLNSQGLAISIDKLKGAKCSNFLVNGVSLLNGSQMGVQIYLSDDVSINDWTFVSAGSRYIMVNQSTRINVLDCEFLAKTGESFPAPDGGNFGFYCYASDVYFSRNIFRMSTSNPLRAVYYNSTIYTSPSATPLVGNNLLTDKDNFRK